MQEGTVELSAPTANAQHCTFQQPCIQCTALKTILNSFYSHSKKVIHVILSTLEINKDTTGLVAKGYYHELPGYYDSHESRR